MASIDEQILKASKEVVVKYIETGRISPALFPNTFKTVYNAIAETVKNPQSQGKGSSHMQPAEKETETHDPS